MSVVAKMLPTEIRFRPRTPKRVIHEIERKYGEYILDDDTVDYFETDVHEDAAKRLAPGDYIHHLREAHGMNLRQLGERLGVSPQYVHDMEKGRRTISKAKAKVLSSMFSLPVERFI